ncbi:CAP domain-containing protein [Moorella naiadis]|uniref:CAP domain-containing protein n=1 Tax=Moorella naiadis (nom. illeg.) TaxID=3093670 RepID=UPI003D9C82FA
MRRKWLITTMNLVFAAALVALPVSAARAVTPVNNAPSITYAYNNSQYISPYWLWHYRQVALNPGSGQASQPAPQPVNPPRPAPVPVRPPRPAPQPQPVPAPQPVPQPAPTGNYQLSDYEQQVIDLVNAERAKAGLKALAADPRLARAARLKAEDMRDHNYFSHESPTYGSFANLLQQSGISFRTAGENIAAGYRTPAAVVAAWMNSPGHRSNILNANFTAIGVGYAAGGSYGTYWAQEFIGN